MRIVVLASGSGTLTQAVLDAAGREYAVAAVVTDQPQAPVRQRARRAGVEDVVVALSDYPDRTAWDEALAVHLSGYSPDWVVSAGFMKILGPSVLTAFHNRIINTHPALLPAFPGAHGVRDALAYGVKVTGTTVHLIDAGVDTGPIISQFPVAIEPTDTAETLHERIKAVERRELVNTLKLFATSTVTVDGRCVVLSAQSNSPQIAIKQGK